MTEERRAPFVIEREKFSTQREVTYWLLLIFAIVVVWVLWQNDQSERSMVLQTVINLTLLAVGYWLGASKQAADSNQTMARIAEGAAPSTASAVAAATGQPPVAAPLKADTVNVQTDVTNVSSPPSPPT